MYGRTPNAPYNTSDEIPRTCTDKKVRNEIQPLPSVFPMNGYPVETIDKIMMKQTQQRG